MQGYVCPKNSITKGIIDALIYKNILDHGKSLASSTHSSKTDQPYYVYAIN